MLKSITSIKIQYCTGLEHKFMYCKLPDPLSLVWVWLREITSKMVNSPDRDGSLFSLCTFAYWKLPRPDEIS